MLVVGIGGTIEGGSAAEIALRMALEPIQSAGVEVRIFTAEAIDLPMYNPQAPGRAPAARELIDAVRASDGMIVASPAIHGAVAAPVKNALDYIEDLRDEEPRYLEDRIVGSIGVGHDWQGTVSVLQELRRIVHSLRGWNTPYGAALTDDRSTFDGGRLIDEDARAKLYLVGQQCYGSLREPDLPGTRHRAVIRGAAWPR